MEDLSIILEHLSHRQLAERLLITKSNINYWLKIDRVPKRHHESLKKIKNLLISELEKQIKSAKKGVKVEKNLSLYGIASEIAVLEEIIAEQEFENEETIAIKMNQLIELMNDKTDAVCGYDQSIVDYVKAIDNRISELEELKVKTISTQKRFHSYILGALDRLGVKKITGKLYNVSYREPSLHVDIEDENKIPAQYVKIKETISINKLQIGKDLKAGIDVEGAKLVAGNRSLSIKAGK